MTLQVAVSSRIVLRNVGGNTRYARAIHLNGDKSYESILLPGKPLDSTLGRISARLYEATLLPRTTRGDVIHFPADNGPLVPCRLPTVTTVHGFASAHIPSVRSHARGRSWVERVKIAIKLSDILITVSESSKRDLVKHLGANPELIRVIPHGVEKKFFGPATYRPSTLDRAGVDEDYILYVGNLDPRKNLVRLIQAANLVFDTSGIKTVIAGAIAWDADPILEQIRTSSGCTYIGRIPEDELPALLAHARCFCFPSLYEGFGLPVLEAMAAGTPVVCSNRGSLDEVAGKAALIVDPESADLIAEGLLKVLYDPEVSSSLVHEGLRNAHGFSWERSIAAHCRAFEEARSAT